MHSSNIEPCILDYNKNPTYLANTNQKYTIITSTTITDKINYINDGNINDDTNNTINKISQSMPIANISSDRITSSIPKNTQCITMYLLSWDHRHSNKLIA